MKEKICLKCGIEKSFEHFYKQKLGKFGFMANCKICTLDYQNKYHLTVAEERKKNAADYYINFTPEGTIYSKRWEN